MVVVLLYRAMRMALTLLIKAKKHGIDVHGYTEKTWNEEIARMEKIFGS
jgi:hypothetical protein